MEKLYEGKPDLKETYEIGHEADPDYRVSNHLLLFYPIGVSIIG
jgi:hypothetical protein